MRTTLAVALAIGVATGLLGAAPASAVTTTSAPQAATSTPSPGKTSTRVAAATAAVASDYSSIFSGDNAALAGSGWAACSAPIQWSVDTTGLTAQQAEAQVANLSWAFAQWSAVSGLSFVYDGVEALTYNDTAFTLTPTDGSATELQHIYLDFVDLGASNRLVGSTVGLGTPSQVMASSKVIVAGDAIFRTDHVQRAGTNELRSLYLHELGHVLGLAHATAKANIMFPIVSAKTSLGSGDVNGVRSITKSCSA